MQYRDLDKQALKTNGYTALTKITIVGTNTVFTEDDHIVDWTYEDYRYVPDTGFIGEFVERILDGNLQDISENTILEDTEINLQLGIVNKTDNQTTWYDYGNFLITSVQKEDTSGNYKFESADYTKKFNIPFKESFENEVMIDGELVPIDGTIVFPCLAGELAEYTCAQAGVELAGYDYNNFCCYHAIGTSDDALLQGDYCLWDDINSKYIKFTLDDYLNEGSVIYFYPNKQKLIVKVISQLISGGITVERKELSFTSSSTKGNYTSLIQRNCTMYDFPNADFVIGTNQYDSDETCRKVMQDIGKLAYSWVRVGTDNKVYIDFTPKQTSSVDQYDQLTTDEYYVSKKSDLTFGPVNKVLIGMEDVEGENMYETSQDYTPETECAIKLWDNNLTNTEELRAIALSGCDRLFGVTYTPITIDTIGHPWLEGDELIKLTNVDGVDIYTYPFNRSIKYSGYIEGTIGAEASTSQNSKYEYKSDIISKVKKTSIIVDKQEQTITALAADVDENTSDISQLQIDLDGISTRVTSVENTEVVAVTNEYAVNNSATTPPAQSSSSWSTDQPTRGTGQYIWARIKTTYKSGSVDYSDPVNTTGDKGDPGAGGKGISSINNYYKTTSTQTQPSASSITSTTIPTMDATDNKYLWQKEVITYTDNTNKTTVNLIGVYGNTGQQGPQGETGQTGATGNGISSITYYYKATSTQTEPSASSITSTTIPTLDATTNKYLWQKEVIAYTNNTNKTTVSLIGVYGNTGPQGETGATGNGINSITYYYATSTTQTAPSASSITSTTIPTLSETNKYLWQKEVIDFTDTSVSDKTTVLLLAVYGDKGNTGDTGPAGNGIQSITYYYATSTTQTAPSASSITSTTIPTLSATNKYLWQKEVIKYTATGSTDKVTVALIAVYGDKGDTGAAGANGSNGAGINTITQYYAVSSSNETAPTVWTTDVSSLTLTETNKYLWNYSVTTYTEGKASTETGKTVIGVYGDKGEDAEPPVLYHDNNIGTTLITEDAGNLELKEINSINGNITQETSVLPSTFTQVEYIQASGTQYINTAYSNTTANTRIVIDVECSNTGTWLYGARSSTGSTDTFGLYTNGASEFWAQVGGNGTNNGGTFAGTVANRNVIDISGTTIKLNGTSMKTYTNTLTTGSKTVFIFGLNNGGSIDGRNLSGKIYSFKIYNNGNLVRNMVPCYRNSDNVIGMYDAVYDVFYTNAGSGTFVKGANKYAPEPEYQVPVDIVTGRQEVRICKRNLLNIPTNSYAANGLTGSWGGNTITVTGTNTKTDAAWVVLSNGITANSLRLPSFKRGERYTITNTNPTSSSQLYFQINYYRNKSTVQNGLATIQLTNSSYTFTVPKDFGSVASIFLGVNPATREIDYTTNIQIEKVENLFDGVMEQGTFDTNGLNSDSAARIRTKNYIPVQPNTQYTTSYVNERTGKTGQLSISYYSKDDYITPRLSYANWSTNNPLTITTPANCNYVRIAVAFSDSTAITTDDIPYLEFGETNQASPYEPYEEKSYEINLGKNLLNYNDLTSAATGVNIAINNKQEVYDSTPTSDARGWGYDNSNWKLHLEKGIYTITLNFSTKCTNTSNGLIIYCKGYTASIAGGTSLFTNLATKSLTFTLHEDLDIGIFLKIFDGVATIQLEKGRVGTSFSPYFEPILLGKINNYKDYIARASDKNLFNKHEVPYKAGAYISNTGQITDNSEFSVYKVPVKENTTYTLTNSGASTSPGYCCYNSNGNLLSGAGYATRANITFTTPIGTSYILLSVVTQTTSSRYDLDIFQLEENSSATTYEPYKGTWCVYKNVGKHIIKPADLASTSANPLTLSKEIRINHSTLGCIVGYNSQLYSNNFRKVGGTWDVDTIGIMSGGGNPITQFALRIPVNATSSWFTDNITTLYYPLATTAIEEITSQELINQLDALEQAKLNEGLNTISIHGNLPGILDVDYWTKYKGETGDGGRGIASIIQHYLATSASSGVTKNTSGWTTSVQTMTSTNKYLWNYTTTTYTSGTLSEDSTPCIIGVYGLTGNTGKGISSVTPLYYCSNSSTAPAKPTTHVTTSSVTVYNAWNIKCANYTTTYKYYYTCSEVKYTDNTYAWTDVVADQSVMFVNNLQIGGRNLLKESTLCGGAPSTNANWERGLGNTITRSDSEDGTIGKVTNPNFGELQIFTTLENLNVKQTEPLTFSCDVKLLPLEDESTPDVSNYVRLGYSLYYDGTSYSPNWYTGAQLKWDEDSAGAKYGEWTRLYTIFPGYTGTVNYQKLMFGVIARADQANSNIRYIIRNAKVEKGNKPTDWTPAPEDIESDINAVQNSLSSYVTTETYTAGINNTKEYVETYASANLVTKSGLDTFEEQFNTKLNQKADTTQISSTATQIVNDAMSGISQTISNVEETFTFNTNGLEIARSGNTMSLLLQNDRMSFMSSGTEKAYMTSNSFVLSELEQLQLGNYAFVVRQNGSIDFKKIK